MRRMEEISGYQQEVYKKTYIQRHLVTKNEMYELYNSGKSHQLCP